jgi:hypothetical protein
MLLLMAISFSHEIICSSLNVIDVYGQTGMCEKLLDLYLLHHRFETNIKKRFYTDANFTLEIHCWSLAQIIVQKLFEN